MKPYRYSRTWAGAYTGPFGVSGIEAVSDLVGSIVFMELP